MHNVVPLSNHPRSQQRKVFVNEFLSYLHRTGHQHGQTTHRLDHSAPRSVARMAYEASLRTKDWLATNPVDLLYAAMPPRPLWTVPSSDAAVALALRFYDFLVASHRLTPQEAAFMEGWVRAAQAGILKTLLSTCIVRFAAQD